MKRTLSFYATPEAQSALEARPDGMSKSEFINAALVAYSADDALTRAIRTLIQSAPTSERSHSDTE